jgi:hypothetical protein
MSPGQSERMPQFAQSALPSSFLRSGRFVQMVDILRYQQEFAREFPLQPCQRLMRRVGPDRRKAAPALVVEFVHLVWIAGEALRGRDLAEIDLRPDAVLVAEGVHARFGGYAGAGEDHDRAESGGHADTLRLKRAPKRHKLSMDWQIHARRMS